MRVQFVGLAAGVGNEGTHQRRLAGRDVKHGLVLCDQPLREMLADAVAALHRPRPAPERPRRLEQFPVAVAGVRERAVRSTCRRSFITTTAWTRLCGSTPITTRSCARDICDLLVSHGQDDARRAALLRAGHSPLEPLPAGGARQGRMPFASHSLKAAGQPVRERPAGTSPDPGRGSNASASIK